MATKKKALQAAAGAGAGAGGAGNSYWIALLGGSVNEIAYAVATDSSNNIIVSGYTTSVGAGSVDALIVKYNSSGTLEWNRTLGGGSADYGYAVAIDSSDNIIVGGQTKSAGVGVNDCLLAKYNSSGTLQWARSLGASSDETAWGVAIDSSDNIIAGGYISTVNGLVLTKYNSSGTFQWARILEGAGQELGYRVATDSSDNIIIAGYTTSVGAGGNELLLAKYNSSGTLQWARSLGGTGTDRAYSVAIDSSDNIIVGGYTSSDGAGGNDFVTAKYNSSGTLQWQRTLGLGGADYLRELAIDSSDNIIAGGYTNSDGAGANDFLIVKYNSSGTLQWQRTLGSSGQEYGYALAVDSSDNIIITGYTASDGAGGNDFLTAKLPPDGSGEGTYGSYVYQEAALTDAAAGLTDAAANIPDAAHDASSTTALTDAAASLTSADAALTEELIEITA